MNKFNKCYKCNEPLKRVGAERNSFKMCASCRGARVGGNSEIRKIFIELKKNPPPPSPDEERFEDDPRAVKEIEYGRVVRQPTVQLASEHSTLGD